MTALTASMLSGASVGTPDGTVICDSCNKQITSVRHLRDEEKDNPTAHSYVTGDAHGWFLRYDL